VWLVVLFILGACLLDCCDSTGFYQGGTMCDCQAALRLEEFLARALNLITFERLIRHTWRGTRGAPPDPPGAPPRPRKGRPQILAKINAGFLP